MASFLKRIYNDIIVGILMYYTDLVFNANS
jgi:hypothetical protein